MQNTYLHTCAADSLLWPLRETQYKVYTRSLPTLTALYLFSGQEDLSTQVERLRQNWAPDSLDDVSLRDYADALRLLIDYDSQMGNREQALWDTRTDIDIDNRLNKVCSYKSTPFIVYSQATTLFAFEYQEKELLEAAVKATQSILEAFPKIKSTYLTIGLSNAAYTLLENLVNAEHYQEADSIAKLLEPTGLMPLVEKKFGDTMAPFIGLYRIYEGQCAAHFNRNEEAEAKINKGIELLSSNEDYALYLSYMGPSANARLAMARKDYQKVEALYQEAIQAVLKESENNPNDWYKDNLCHYYLGIADCYIAQGQTKQAKKWLKLAEKNASFELDKQLIQKRK